MAISRTDLRRQLMGNKTKTYAHVKDLRGRVPSDGATRDMYGIVPGPVKPVLDAIHTDIVRETISGYADNRVLGAPAPEVDRCESLLPRRCQVVLAQLRSGFCSKLKDFQHRIGKADNDTCPDCNAAQSSTSHLFGCPAFPTNLTPEDL